MDSLATQRTFLFYFVHLLFSGVVAYEYLAEQPQFYGGIGSSAINVGDGAPQFFQQQQFQSDELPMPMPAVADDRFVQSGGWGGGEVLGAVQLPQYSVPIQYSEEIPQWTQYAATPWYETYHDYHVPVASLPQQPVPSVAEGTGKTLRASKTTGKLKGRKKRWRKVIKRRGHKNTKFRKHKKTKLKRRRKVKQRKNRKAKLKKHNSKMLLSRRQYPSRGKKLKRIKGNKLKSQSKKHKKDQKMKGKQDQSKSPKNKNKKRGKGSSREKILKRRKAPRKRQNRNNETQKRLGFNRKHQRSKMKENNSRFRIKNNYRSFRMQKGSMQRNKSQIMKRQQSRNMMAYPKGPIRHPSTAAADGRGATSKIHVFRRPRCKTTAVNMMQDQMTQRLLALGFNNEQIQALFGEGISYEVLEQLLGGNSLDKTDMSFEQLLALAQATDGKSTMANQEIAGTGITPMEIEELLQATGLSPKEIQYLFGGTDITFKEIQGLINGGTTTGSYNVVQAMLSAGKPYQDIQAFLGGTGMNSELIQGLMEGGSIGRYSAEVVQALLGAGHSYHDVQSLLGGEGNSLQVIQALHTAGKSDDDILILLGGVEDHQGLHTIPGGGIANWHGSWLQGDQSRENGKLGLHGVSNYKPGLLMGRTVSEGHRGKWAQTGGSKGGKIVEGATQYGKGGVKSVLIGNVGSKGATGMGNLGELKEPQGLVSKNPNSSGVNLFHGQGMKTGNKGIEKSKGEQLDTGKFELGHYGATGNIQVQDAALYGGQANGFRENAGKMKNGGEWSWLGGRNGNGMPVWDAWKQSGKRWKKYFSGEQFYKDMKEASRNKARKNKVFLEYLWKRNWNNNKHPWKTRGIRKIRKGRGKRIKRKRFNGAGRIWLLRGGNHRRISKRGNGIWSLGAGKHNNGLRVKSLGVNWERGLRREKAKQITEGLNPLPTGNRRPRLFGGGQAVPGKYKQRIRGGRSEQKLGVWSMGGADLQRQRGGQGMWSFGENISLKKNRRGKMKKGREWSQSTNGMQARVVKQKGRDVWSLGSSGERQHRGKMDNRVGLQGPNSSVLGSAAKNKNEGVTWFLDGVDDGSGNMGIQKLRGKRSGGGFLLQGIAPFSEQQNRSSSSGFGGFRILDRIKRDEGIKPQSYNRKAAKRLMQGEHGSYWTMGMGRGNKEFNRREHKQSGRGILSFGGSNGKGLLERWQAPGSRWSMSENSSQNGLFTLGQGNQGGGGIRPLGRITSQRYTQGGNSLSQIGQGASGFLRGKNDGSLWSGGEERELGGVQRRGTEGGKSIWSFGGNGRQSHGMQGSTWSLRGNKGSGAVKRRGSKREEGSWLSRGNGGQSKGRHGSIWSSGGNGGQSAGRQGSAWSLGDNRGSLLFVGNGGHPARQKGSTWSFVGNNGPAAGHQGSKWSFGGKPVADGGRAAGRQGITWLLGGKKVSGGVKHGGAKRVQGSTWSFGENGGNAAGLVRQGSSWSLRGKNGSGGVKHGGAKRGQGSWFFGGNGGQAAGRQGSIWSFGGNGEQAGARGRQGSSWSLGGKKGSGYVERVVDKIGHGNWSVGGNNGPAAGQPSSIWSFGGKGGQGTGRQGINWSFGGKRGSGGEKRKGAKTGQGSWLIGGNNGLAAGQQGSIWSFGGKGGQAAGRQGINWSFGGKRGSGGVKRGGAKAGQGSWSFGKNGGQAAGLNSIWFVDGKEGGKREKKQGQQGIWSPQGRNQGTIWSQGASNGGQNRVWSLGRGALGGYQGKGGLRSLRGSSGMQGRGNMGQGGIWSLGGNSGMQGRGNMGQGGILSIGGSSGMQGRGYMGQGGIWSLGGNSGMQGRGNMGQGGIWSLRGNSGMQGRGNMGQRGIWSTGMGRGTGLFGRSRGIVMPMGQGGMEVATMQRGQVWPGGMWSMGRNRGGIGGFAIPRSRLVGGSAGYGSGMKRHGMGWGGGNSTAGGNRGGQWYAWRGSYPVLTGGSGAAWSYGGRRGIKRPLEKQKNNKKKLQTNKRVPEGHRKKGHKEASPQRAKRKKRRRGASLKSPDKLKTSESSTEKEGASGRRQATLLGTGLGLGRGLGLGIGGLNKLGTSGLLKGVKMGRKGGKKEENSQLGNILKTGASAIEFVGQAGRSAADLLEAGAKVRKLTKGTRKRAMNLIRGGNRAVKRGARGRSKKMRKWFRNGSKAGKKGGRVRRGRRRKRGRGKRGRRRKSKRKHSREEPPRDDESGEGPNDRIERSEEIDENYEVEEEIPEDEDDSSEEVEIDEIGDADESQEEENSGSIEEID